MAGKGLDVDGELRALEPTLRAIARRYEGVRGLEFDELLQRGRIGAWTALCDYRPGSRSLRRWALMRAETRMADAARQAAGGARTLLRDAERVVEFEGEWVDAIDRIACAHADPATIVARRETLAELAHGIHALPLEQRRALLHKANGSSRTRLGPAGEAALAALGSVVAVA